MFMKEPFMSAIQSFLQTYIRLAAHNGQFIPGLARLH